jgi:serine-type D-Ala-D-Ala endopeptidase (penicillin-binding protein 7)
LILSFKRLLARVAVLVCSATLPLGSLDAAAAQPVPAAKAAQAKRAAAGRAVAPAKAARPAPRKAVVAGNGLRLKATKSRRAAPPVPSLGQLAGLHATEDELELKSAVALVVDQDTNEVLFSKNPQAVLPIASITKLMTALVVTEAGLSMDEPLTVSPDDVTSTSNTRSRLAVGTQLTRGEMLHLSLMASENRAAQVLGRTFPGGIERFVQSMNRKAVGSA